MNDEIKRHSLLNRIFRQIRKIGPASWLSYAAVLILGGVIFWQECRIDDLEQRIASVEQQDYYNWVNYVQWEADTNKEKLKEHDTILYRLQGHTEDLQFRVMELEWDLYGKKGK